MKLKIFLVWLAVVIASPVLMNIPAIEYWVAGFVAGLPLLWILRWFSGLSMKGYGEHSYSDIQKAREEGRQQGYNNGFNNGRMM